MQQLQAQLIAKDLKIKRLEAELLAANDTIESLQKHLQNAGALLDNQAAQHQSSGNPSSDQHASARHHVPPQSCTLESRSVDSHNRGLGEVVLCCDRVAHRISAFLYGESSLTCSMRVCRGSSLRRTRCLQDGDVITVNRKRLFHPEWRTIQFAVQDRSHFFLVVELAGTWSTKDTFRIGVSREQIPLEGEDGNKEGYWLSPKSGNLLGADGTRHFIPGLDCPFRNGKGVERGKGKGRGKGSSTQARRGADENGDGAGSIAINGNLDGRSIWAVEYFNGYLDFFFAASRDSPLQNLGEVRFAEWKLPTISPSYLPSLLLRCPERFKPYLWERDGIQAVNQQPFASLQVHFAGTPPCQVSRCVVGQSISTVSWLDLSAGRLQVYRRNQSLRFIEPSTFELCHLASLAGTGAWECWPFEISDCQHFKVAVRVEREWEEKDEFVLGIVPTGAVNPFPKEFVQVLSSKRKSVGGWSNRYDRQGYSYKQYLKFPDEFEHEILFNPWTGEIDGILHESSLLGRWNTWPGGSGLCRSTLGKSRGSGPLSKGGVWAISFQAGVISIFYGMRKLYEKKVSVPQGCVPILWTRCRDVRDYTKGLRNGKGKGRYPRRHTDPLRPGAIAIRCSSAQLRVIPIADIPFTNESIQGEVELACFQALADAGRSIDTMRYRLKRLEEEVYNNRRDDYYDDDFN